MRGDKEELVKLFLRGARPRTATWTWDLALACVLEDTTTAFPLQISTHVASSNPREAEKQTHFLDVQHRSFNKQPLRVPPHTARVEQHKPTPQNDLNACLSLQGTGFQAVAGLEQSEMAPEVQHGACFWWSCTQEDQNTCTCSLWREEDGQIQEKRQFCWDTLPDQAVRKQRTGASVFLYMKSLAARIGLGEMLFE